MDQQKETTREGKHGGVSSQGCVANTAAAKLYQETPVLPHLPVVAILWQSKFVLLWSGSAVHFKNGRMDVPIPLICCDSDFAYACFAYVTRLMSGTFYAPTNGNVQVCNSCCPEQKRKLVLQLLPEMKLNAACAQRSMRLQSYFDDSLLWTGWCISISALKTHIFLEMEIFHSLAKTSRNCLFSAYELSLPFFLKR